MSTCPKCGTIGHMRKHCLISQYDGADPSHLICISCNKVGHYMCKQTVKKKDLEVEFRIPEIESDDEEDFLFTMNEEKICKIVQGS
jgi:hypothetical protein